MSPSKPPSEKLTEYLQTQICVDDVFVLEKKSKTHMSLKFFIVSKQPDLDLPNAYGKNSIIQLLDGGERIKTGKKLLKEKIPAVFGKNFYSNPALTDDLIYNLQSYCTEWAILPHIAKRNGKYNSLLEIFEKNLGNQNNISVLSLLKLERKLNLFSQDMFEDNLEIKK